MTWDDFFNDPIGMLDQAIPDYFAFDFNDDSIPDIEFRCTGDSPIPNQFAFNFDSDRVAEAVLEFRIGDDGSIQTSFKADINSDNKVDFGISDQNGDLWPDIAAADWNLDGALKEVIPTSSFGIVESAMRGDGRFEDWLQVDEKMTQLPPESSQNGSVAYGEFESLPTEDTTGLFARGTASDDFQSRWQEDWHQQQSDSSCAVCCQEFILDEALGRDVTEHELISVASKLGIYSPLGTALADVGSLLDYYGVPSEIHVHSDLGDMLSYARNGHGVIAMIDCNEIWGTEELTDCRGIPMCGANHAVQILGVEITNGQANIVLNDPGHPDGCGMRVPIETFMDAWHDSEKAMCITKSPVLM